MNIVQRNKVNLSNLISMSKEHSIGYWLLYGFVKLGVLPLFLAVAVIVFTLLSRNFLSVQNLTNVSRQSTYLVVISLGQMLVLLTGGFDLSVGTIVALSSVVGATAMSSVYASTPEAIGLAILAGVLAGLAAGIVMATLNGIGVAVFNVSPFVMTLGMSSVGFGVALYMTGGVPVYGMPPEYSDLFGFGRWLTIPTPIWITVGLILLIYLFLSWTRYGRYLYAIGGNIQAAALSGISTKWNLFLAYVLSGVLAALSGLLLTARIETGEANIGASFPLASITACVIGGVSLRGGTGRVGNVVLGAIFIGLVQNGMNLAHIESYLQTVVIGILLILAVIADQLRQRYALTLSE